MTDLMSRLAAARPTDVELDAIWAPDERADVLGVILAGPLRRRPGRRTTLVAAAAGLAAAAFLPPVLDPGSAAAADLHVLAHSVVSYDGPVLAQGSWLHEKVSSLQRNSPDVDDGAIYDDEIESWTSWDGRTLRVEHRPSAGWTEYDVVDDNSSPSYQDPTPEFSATLPDDADGLLAYLGPRVTGSSSHAEAMYTALIQLAGSHTLPPRTLAATFDALARIDHVATSDVVVDGRAAVEVSYDESLTSSTEAVAFDRATGQALSTHERSDRSDYTSTTTLSEVVDQVPADVQVTFRSHRDGVRYDAAGVALGG